MADYIPDIIISLKPESLFLILFPEELILILPFVIPSAYKRSEMLNSSTFFDI